MLRIISIIIAIMGYQTIMAQTCTYLAYDGFDYAANTPLNALNGGTGWDLPWATQNDDIAIPGYQINNGSGSLTYNALQTMGRYGIGGNAYLTAGRRLNTADNSPFADYVADYDNGIGTQIGDTLWTSFVLRKNNNNNEEVWVDLHDQGGIGWCSGCASQHIAVGYFGSTNSNVGGQAHWTLRLNNTYYPTSVAISPNSNTFITLRIIFNPNNTNVAIYINPTNLGNNLPSPTLTQSSNQANIIRSVAVYLGDNVNNGGIDELRFGSTYACVAPDNTISVNLPPTAQITTDINSGIVPLTVNFSGTNSTDPESGSLTYTWNFGDGTPTQTGATTSHTYTNTLGIITASLTVTDNVGLQHTTYHTLTLTNASGTYPCQTTFTVQRMASCNTNNARVDINAQAGVSFQLRNANNDLMPISNGNQYDNLANGIYTFTATDNVCTDTFSLHIVTDSTTCNNWQASNCAMDIGTNLSGLADWTVERPMKNLFKHVRPEPIPFTTTCFCWYVPDILNQMTFTDEGYPTHIPQTTTAGSNTVIRYVLSSESESGTNLQMNTDYVLLYDGAGTLQIGGGVAISSNTTGRIQFSLLGNNNIFVEILSSTAGNPIRNMRLLRIADEFADLTANPFYEGFTNKIAPFSYLRFMDWGSTNANLSVNWSERSNVNYFTYGTTNGVPYEIMIQLANQLQKDVWICVPHAANNDYIAQMATLFRDNLNPNLTIYLEYSNEVWNWIFPQANYNADNSPSNLNYGRAYAEKAKNVFDIWHTVFGNDKQRVKRVLGLQVTYNYLNEHILSQLKQSDWDYGSPTHYFGLDHSSTATPVLNASSTVTDIINNSRNTWYAYKESFKRDYNQVKLFGKTVITYEGGQHFVGNSFGIPYDYQQAMWDAQYTPQIYDLYNEVLDTIRNWGCTKATNFSLATPQESVYGSWGVLNDIDIQPPYLTTAPKYQAVIDNMPIKPTPIITGNNTVCQNMMQTYTVVAVSNTTYIWTVTGGTIVSGQGTNQINVQWGSNGVGTVSITQQAD